MENKSYLSLVNSLLYQSEVDEFVDIKTAYKIQNLLKGYIKDENYSVCIDILRKSLTACGKCASRNKFNKNDPYTSEFLLVYSWFCNFYAWVLYKLSEYERAEQMLIAAVVIRPEITNEYIENCDIVYSKIGLQMGYIPGSFKRILEIRIGKNIIDSCFDELMHNLKSNVLPGYYQNNHDEQQSKEGERQEQKIENINGNNKIKKIYTKACENADLLVVEKFIMDNGKVVLEVIIRKKEIRVGSYLLIGDNIQCFATRIINLDFQVSNIEINRDNSIYIIDRGQPKCREILDSASTGDQVCIMVEGNEGKFDFISDDELTAAKLITIDEYNKYISR